MAIEDFFNEKTIVDLSFFNFRNSVTAAYFANEKLEVQKVNENSVHFFQSLGMSPTFIFPMYLSNWVFLANRSITLFGRSKKRARF